MGSFLKDNWIWIVGPILFILLGVGLLIYLSQGNDDGGGEFFYDLI